MRRAPGDVPYSGRVRALEDVVAVGGRVKISSVLDQGDDTEVNPLHPATVRKLADVYRKHHSGIDAQPEEEMTAEQLAALRAKVALDVAPYADFGILRLYGGRLQRTLKFQAKVFSPDTGAWVTKEMQGPSSFVEWRRAFRVYRYGLVVLNIADAAFVDRYFERVNRLYTEYGRLGGGTTCGGSCT